MPKGSVNSLHYTSYQDSVPPADQWEQITENGHLTIGRWHNFFHTSLAAWEQEWHGFPKRGIGAHISFNIEESIFPYLGFYDKTDGPHPLWPTWNSIKDVTTLAEFAGGTKTYQQIRDDGEWTAEMDTRFANRMALSLMVFGQGGAYTGTGFSYWHVEPQTDKLNSEDIFLGEKNMRFWHVPGYSSTNKTITLNGRTYPAPDGHFQKLQTFHDDYKYIIDLSYIKSNTEYNLEPDSRSMQRFLRTRHVTADAIGRDMINMDRMMRNHGKLIANVFQQQHYAEQNLFSPYSWYDASEKIDLPPYIVYSQRTIREFIWSGIPGSGYFGFDNYITDNTMPREVVPSHQLATHMRYNKYWDTYHAISAAGNTFRNFHGFLKTAILTFNLEIKPQGSSSFSIYNGLDAFGRTSGGGNYAMKPAIATKHSFNAQGLTIVFCVGHEQEVDDVRTDHFRIPNIMGTNYIEVTYKGIGTRWFEVFIPNGATGRKFTAYSLVQGREVPGSDGYII